MAALTADQSRPTRNEHCAKLAYFPVAASTLIYQGSLVCVDAAGNAVNGADTASYKFVGIANRRADNSSGSAGAISVEVKYGHTERLATTAAAFTQITAPRTVCTVSDSDTVTTAAVTTNDVEVGVITQYEATDFVWVDICEATQNA